MLGVSFKSLEADWRFATLSRSCIYWHEQGASGGFNEGSVKYGIDKAITKYSHIAAEPKPSSKLESRIHYDGR
jgi:hypothetical protein